MIALPAAAWLLIAGTAPAVGDDSGAAANRYEGAGGVFSESSCEQRGEQPALGGTCVFHCRQPDETLWHPLQGEPGSEGGAASGAMMSRACDLYYDYPK